jgi:uncharacterized protein YcbX
MIEAWIKNIQIQPMKGAGALPLQEARITKRGLETLSGNIQDHFLFVVDGKPDVHGDHNFLTQRIRIDPEKNLLVPGDRRLAAFHPSIRWDGSLVFQYNNERFAVPHKHEDDPTRVLPVQVWEHRGKAIEVPRMSEWMSDMLGRPLKVARTAGAWNRMARQNYEVNDNPMGAQDGYPIHAVAYSDAEVSFNALGAAVDPNRFRYQLLLGGLKPGQIHAYEELSINDVKIRQPKPCARCEVTGNDQQTGELSPIKPLAGLVKARVPRWISGEDKSGKPQMEHIMGENWLPKGDTFVREGDTVRFLTPRQKPLVLEKK